MASIDFMCFLCWFGFFSFEARHQWIWTSEQSYILYASTRQFSRSKSARHAARPRLLLLGGCGRIGTAAAVHLMKRAPGPLEVRFFLRFVVSVFSMIFSYWKDTKIYHTLAGSLGIYTSIELAELVSSSGPGDLGRPQGWSRQSSCEGGESWGFGKVASNVSVSRPGFL